MSQQPAIPPWGKGSSPSSCHSCQWKLEQHPASSFKTFVGLFLW